ncbi:type I restriction enzyme HsdR N-terminal domain-containing protein [Campylobacter sp. LR264d]|uniref:type I restriction enzyme HsdR N-terminal domain-containing protein n=1 Tax=Campylobacter sp. LR264d TaxID=2593544 RepID=UPI0012384CBB|nr:type I restriction enzyme HsdR N-terminal domain-containing protein [Campylobacter sp. LR264d]KAA6234471.1 type I restriction enzyme HsdR N-terminal domain-containing protein [Campylobacter sp. LR264d]
MYHSWQNDDGDYFKLTPEEIVRQHYAHMLIETYNYTKEQIIFKTPVLFARKSKIREKRTDIIVLDKYDRNKINLLIEVKRPNEQMKSYCSQQNPKIGVIANGDNLLKFYAFPYFNEELGIDKFPKNGEDLNEWM